MVSQVVWKPVSGASHYEVSSDGRVRSVDRYVEYKDGRKPRYFPSKELKQNFLWAGGYLGVTYTDDEGKRRIKSVHQLICEAFHGPKPEPDYEVRHLNGIKTDNRAENLRWGTRSENAYDTVRHGGNVWANKKTCPKGHPLDMVSSHNRRWCSTCKAEYYRRNRERLLAWHRDNYARNRERILARRKERQQAS